MLRNAGNTSFAIGYKLFSIIGNTRRGEKLYHYYVRFFFSKDLGGWKIYKSKNKSKYLNKYTLSAIGFIANVFYYPIKALVFVLTPVTMYANGFFELIINGDFYSEVKVFSLVNFAAAIGLIAWLIFN